MKYVNGPLEVTKPDTDYVITIELGQGSRGFVHAAGDLEEAVSDTLKKGKQPPAFMTALEELQQVGRDSNWDWKAISRGSSE